MSVCCLSCAALKAVFPVLSEDRAARLTEVAVQILPTYGIEELDVVQEFIAQAGWESSEFMSKNENLNYSASSLMETFGKKHFPTLLMAQRYAHQPEKIANYVYGGRMGNRKMGDGWTFRGGGFIQLTGRDIYTQYGIRNKMEAEAIATLCRTDDWWAMDSAAWFFAVAKNLVPIARKEDFKELTHRINGGFNGEDGRERLWAMCKQFLVNPA